MVGGEQNNSTQKLENSELLSLPSSNELSVRDLWIVGRHCPSKEGQYIRPRQEVGFRSSSALECKFVYLISATL